MKKLIFLVAIFAGLSLLLIKPAISQQQTSSQIYVIKIDNYIINPITAKFISKAIQEATANDATCLIIELDTPGGLLESTRTIVKDILNAKIPIVTYIAPSGSRAGSAGVFITYASHVAAMAPSTNIGAAHPIGIGFTPPPAPTGEKVVEEIKEKQKEKDVLEEKIMNDILAWVEGIAKTRKRNIEWVKEAVTESVSVSEKEALENNVVDIIAIDLDDLIKQIDGKTVETNYGQKIINTKAADINTVALSNHEKVLHAIAHPNIAYILMLLGVLGLIFEFTHPGIGFPGIAGLICLLLAAYSFQLLPINYAGLLLIILSIVLFIAEALTPTFGLLTLGGIVSFIFGSLMLIDTQYPFLKISLNAIIPAVITFAAITLFLVANLLKTHRRKITTGKQGLIGQTATAISTIKRKGKVSCHGEIWTAYNTKKHIIKKGDEVKVVKVEGLKLFVEKDK